MADGFEFDITSDLADAPASPQPAQVDHAAQDAGAKPANVPPGSQLHQGPDTVRVTDRAQTPAKPEASLRDQLTAAFKGEGNKPTDQKGADTAAPLALTKDAAGKYRLPDGTFASVEQVTAFEKAQAPAAQPADQAAAQSPVLQGMTPAEVQQFQSLPAELRQYVERTMEGLNTRAARYGEYDRIEQGIIAGRREGFQAQGYTPETAISALFQLSDFAGSDPSNFVLWFAKQHNLDLDALLDARDAAEAGGQGDPAVAALRGELQTLRNTVTGMTDERAQAEHQARLTNVQNFAVEKDDKGGLKRPYLPEVMDAWPHHITAIKAANPTMGNDELLQKAYDAACWADAGVRGKMQAEAARARTADPAAVEAARAAAVGITGAPTGNEGRTPNNPARTVREELEVQFAAARA